MLRPSQSALVPTRQAMEIPGDYSEIFEAIRNFLIRFPSDSPLIKSGKPEGKTK